MIAGIVSLCLAYVLSQFFRSFLAVLTGILGQDIGVIPDDLSTASGLWFLSFALMQIPVGGALDRIGPRLTAAVLFLIGGAGGAALFAVAQTALHVKLAMLLIGIGCSPVLMASYYIFARVYSSRIFATLAATTIGVGSVGNLAGSVPLVWVVQIYGWRETLWGLAVVSALIAIATFIFVRNPPKVESAQVGGFSDLLKMPVLWLIIPLVFVNYLPVAALRGLWIGPYLVDTFGANAAQVGNASMMMSLAIIAGTFAYGPLDRVFGSRKWVIFAGNVIVLTALVALLLSGDFSFTWAVSLLTAIGFFGMSFPMIVAHGRAFAPPQIAGRGVTLMNLFSISGVGFFQVVSGKMHAAQIALGITGAARYSDILLLMSGLIAISLLIYAFSKDNLD
jgi:predicted MFS family arabinose efflux permease